VSKLINPTRWWIAGGAKAGQDGEPEPLASTEILDLSAYTNAQGPNLSKPADLLSGAEAGDGKFIILEANEAPSSDFLDEKDFLLTPGPRMAIQRDTAGAKSIDIVAIWRVY